MTSTPNVCSVAGLNLGTATFSSPVRQQAHNSRRSTVCASTVNAVRLNNELAGDTGEVLPVPGTNRSLFSSTPRNPTSVGTPSMLRTASLQGPPAAAPPQVPRPLGGPPGHTIIVDGRPLCLTATPADQDNFAVCNKTQQHPPT